MAEQEEVPHPDATNDVVSQLLLQSFEQLAPPLPQLLRHESVHELLLHPVSLQLL